MKKIKFSEKQNWTRAEYQYRCSGKFVLLKFDESHRVVEVDIAEKMQRPITSYDL